MEGWQRALQPGQLVAGIFFHLGAIRHLPRWWAVQQGAPSVTGCAVTPGLASLACLALSLDLETGDDVRRMRGEREEERLVEPACARGCRWSPGRLQKVSGCSRGLPALPGQGVVCGSREG